MSRLPLARVEGPSSAVGSFPLRGLCLNQRANHDRSPAIVTPCRHLRLQGAIALAGLSRRRTVTGEQARRVAGGLKLSDPELDLVRASRATGNQ